MARLKLWDFSDGDAGGDKLGDADSERCLGNGGRRCRIDGLETSDLGGCCRLATASVRVCFQCDGFSLICH